MRRTCSILVLILFSCVGSYACSCFPPNTISEEYQQSGVVFIGRVVSIRFDSAYQYAYVPGYIVTLTVLERWKGASGTETRIWTATDGTACGFPFEPDSTYLVYASGGDSTISYTSWCTRTTDIHSADEDLEFLSTVTSVSNLINPLAINGLSIQGYPNPANPTAILRYSVPATTMINVSLYSVTGELIEVLFNGISTAGVSEVTIDASRISSGAYFARIVSEHEVATTRLLIVR